MIEGQNKVLQALLGTLLTWGLTAAGSALVFIFSTGKFVNQKRKILDTSLGFAAGVMTAASYWSLLSPAIEMAEKSGYYGAEGQYAFAPIAIGFALGGLFVLISDKCIPHVKDPAVSLAQHTSHKVKKIDDETHVTESEILRATEVQVDLERVSLREESMADGDDVLTDSVELKVRNRKQESKEPKMVLEYTIENVKEKDKLRKIEAYQSWKRMLLLIIAITVHNIPEGLAVGVSFGAIGTSESATFQSARNLAIGIGIQNFPEGMAVSIPLAAAGYTPLKSFWYGQLSGMVEPVFGVLGALVVVVAEPILPYALAFAAGAMIYVVVDDIIPEANMCGNGRLASVGTMVGFIVMMTLDVALG